MKGGVFMANKIEHRVGRPRIARPNNKELLQAYDNEPSVRRLAETYGVSKSTMANWLADARQKQSLFSSIFRAKK